MGSTVFLKIGLTKTCIAIDMSPPPPHGNLTNAPRGRQGNAKQIVRNNVFECTTLLKIEVKEYGIWFLNGLKCILRDKDFNESGVQSPSHTLPTSLLAPSVQAFDFQSPPPLSKQPLWVQPFLYIYSVVFSLWQYVVYDSNFDLHFQLQYRNGNKEDVTMTLTISRRGSVLRLTDSNLSMYIELLKL